MGGSSSSTIAAAADVVVIIIIIMFTVVGAFGQAGHVLLEHGFVAVDEQNEMLGTDVRRVSGPARVVLVVEVVIERIVVRG